ncbi:MAG: hypothetical protein KF734_08450 [Saprospiraceae bacterium]|nr:hypothetical protein [Saprospiraceae bacterium]
MKRTNHLIEQIADPDNLRLAFWKARKGKSHAPGVEAYRAALDVNLQGLREQILTGLVEVGKYHYFKVYEPKERKICAAAFGEQVLHHALMNVCHPHFERCQISDSYASRKGKGMYAALGQARRYSCNHRWYLKLDVRKFFESVHHGVVREQLGRLFKDPTLLDIFEKIIDSYEACPERGLPIGNLTSQYFANHYLSGLDHFVKRDLRIKAYVRYMDDMVLWSDDKAALKNALGAITEWVEKRLLCTLKPAQLNRTANGLPFLGYRVQPYSARLLGPSKRRFVRKLRRADALLDSGAWGQAMYQRRVTPLYAFLGHADTVGLRSAVLRFVGPDAN